MLCFRVYVTFVIRGHVWNFLQGHSYACDRACLPKGTLGLNIAHVCLEKSKPFFFFTVTKFLLS